MPIRPMPGSAGQGCTTGRSLFTLDDPGPDPYVRPAMNLLLLLSALLSALNGVGVAVRRQELAQSVAQIAAAADRVCDTTAAASSRPRAAMPSLAQVAAAGTRRAVPLFAAIAPWTERRRE